MVSWSRGLTDMHVCKPTHNFAEDMHGLLTSAGHQRVASLQGLRDNAVATAALPCVRMSTHVSAMSLTLPAPSAPALGAAAPSPPASIPLGSARSQCCQAMSTARSERVSERAGQGSETRADRGVQHAARPSQLRYPVVRGCC